MLKPLAVIIAAVSLVACGGSNAPAAPPSDAPSDPVGPGADGSCRGTSCADPHPPGWQALAATGVSNHGNAVLAGDHSCGNCHTQTGSGNSGQLDGIKNGDAHDGLICTHCHLSGGPGQTLFVAGKIHVDGWGTAERAARVQADTLAPLKGGVQAGCLACHLNG
jgi:hypothetical protein